MKEIGEILKKTRESNGVTLDEAAEDLNLKKEQLKVLETGDFDPFKDLNYIKGLVRDYSKYLGLDSDKIVNDFNEFIFDYTSKIPIIKPKQEDEEEKVTSPYTSKKNFMSIFPWYGYILLLVLFIILVLIYISQQSIKEEETTLGVNYYELSQ